MKAAQVAMKHPATAVELMDKIILDCTKESIEYSRTAISSKGILALLMIEFRGKTLELKHGQRGGLIADLKAGRFGYAYPVIGPDKTASAWALRVQDWDCWAISPATQKRWPVLRIRLWISMIWRIISMNWMRR
jgi:hypothetical protein